MWWSRAEGGRYSSQSIPLRAAAKSPSVITGISCSTFTQLHRGQGAARPPERFKAEITRVSELTMWKMSQNLILFLQICVSVGKSPNRIKEEDQTSANGAPWDTSRWSGRLGSTGSRERQRKVKVKYCRSVLQDPVLALDTNSHLHPAQQLPSTHPFPIHEPGKLQELELLAWGQRGLWCIPGWIFKHIMDALPLRE